MTSTGNPKDKMGAAKPDPSLIPPIAILEDAHAHWDGADKYGPFNWRETGVKARVYIAAAMRHIMAYQDGEDHSRDTRFVRIKGPEDIATQRGLVVGDVMRVSDEYPSADAPGLIMVEVKGANGLVVLSPTYYETVREPVKHLAHARACLAIIMDADSVDKLIDDRPARGKAGDTVKRLTIING